MVAGIELAQRLIDPSSTIQACPANCGICKITVLIYILCDSTINYRSSTFIACNSPMNAAITVYVPL